MNQRIAFVTLVVEDYDDAISFYIEKLGFTLVEDTRIDNKKRWVLIAPKGVSDCCLLLAKAATGEQRGSIGNQSGGRVSFFLYTDDFWRDYNAMIAKGVLFVREPKTEPYGTVAVFKDLYGNLWDLLQPQVS